MSVLISPGHHCTLCIVNCLKCHKGRRCVWEICLFHNLPLLSHRHIMTGSASATDPTSLFVLFLLGQCCTKKPKPPSFQIGSRIKFGRIFDSSHFQDDDHDIISRRKMLPSGVCTCSIHAVPTAAYASASAG